jgi:predicted kinase
MSKITKIYYTVGISGSGKSTYLNSNFNKSIVVSSDEIRKKYFGSVNFNVDNNKVFKKVDEVLFETINKYNQAVLDATNLNIKLLIENTNKIKEKFPDNEFEFILLIFNSTPEISKQRIKKDIENKVERSNVPENVVDIQYDRFKTLMKELSSSKYKNIFTIQYIKNPLRTFEEFQNSEYL